VLFRSPQSKTKMATTRSQDAANSNDTAKIVITTAESRTGDAIMQEAELLAKQGGKLDFCGLYPPNIQPLQLQYGKSIQGDVASASVEELASLLQGAHTVILIPPATQYKVDIAAKLTQAAVTAGVPNMILISDIRLNNIPDEPAVAMFGQIEEGAKQLAKGKANLIILRAGHYMQNLFLYAVQMQNEGALGLPTGDGKMAPIDVRDVALISLTVASNPQAHAGQVYNLSGLEALNGHEMMQVAREAGLPEKLANFKNISEKELANLYRQIPDLDPSEGERNRADFAFVRENGDKVFPDAKKLSSRPPTTLLEFFKEYKGIFLGAST